MSNKDNKFLQEISSGGHQAKRRKEEKTLLSPRNGKACRIDQNALPLVFSSFLLFGWWTLLSFLQEIIYTLSLNGLR
jgi:hypothetical protein